MNRFILLPSCFRKYNPVFPYIIPCFPIKHKKNSPDSEEITVRGTKFKA